eukprot:TRINITY_DN19294_c0_g1_i10.p3 TRINITY_DN19294_c0_g1~~TRINITY_DN19294_c0_g1_i10.p3  ORF type:complete len:206 (-),score=-25.27 TRINITY_DN19294_c0_g1_i10:30-647(-)
MSAVTLHIKKISIPFFQSNKLASNQSLTQSPMCIYVSTYKYPTLIYTRSNVHMLIQNKHPPNQKKKIKQNIYQTILLYIQCILILYIYLFRQVHHQHIILHTFSFQTRWTMQACMSTRERERVGNTCNKKKQINQIKEKHPNVKNTKKQRLIYNIVQKFYQKCHVLSSVCQYINTTRVTQYSYIWIIILRILKICTILVLLTYFI